MATFNSVENFLKNFRSASFGLYAATLTDLTMNKYPCGTARKDMTAENLNPYIGRVKSLTLYQNAATGCSYYNLVESECRREGIHFSKEEFALAFPKERTYASSDDNKLFVNEKSGCKYLRLYRNRRPTNVRYYTVIDGEIVAEDDARIKDIMRYVSPKKESAKQEGIGIKNIIPVRNIHVENVMLLQQGDKSYLNEDFGLFGEKVAEMVKTAFKD